MKDAYLQKIDAQMEDWKSEIDKMKAKADKAEAGAKLEYYKQIEELREKQQAAQEKLTELKSSGEDAWEDLKAGFELARVSLGEAIKSASSRF
jgi:uncharacterized coiled-coil DUF342 family protein